MVPHARPFAGRHRLQLRHDLGGGLARHRSGQRHLRRRRKARPSPRDADRSGHHFPGGGLGRGLALRARRSPGHHGALPAALGPFVWVRRASGDLGLAGRDRGFARRRRLRRRRDRATAAGAQLVDEGHEDAAECALGVFHVSLLINALL